MKVVLMSNFSDESIAESLHAENIDIIEAERIAYEWNRQNASGHSTYYAVVKDDNYRLWRGMADLV